MQFTGVTGTSRKRNFAKNYVSVTGNKPIQQVTEGLDQRKAQDNGEDPPTLKARQEGQKGIEPTSNLPIGMYEESNMGATRPINFSQSLLGLFALIGHHAHRRGIGVRLQSFEAFLRGDTQAAFAVID